MSDGGGRGLMHTWFMMCVYPGSSGERVSLSIWFSERVLSEVFICVLMRCGAQRRSHYPNSFNSSSTTSQECYGFSVCHCFSACFDCGV